VETAASIVAKINKILFIGNEGFEMIDALGVKISVVQILKSRRKGIKQISQQKLKSLKKC
jgi:hypothetical protein